MPDKVKLFIIDPQEDFCNPNGNLFVPGADEDMKRVAKMIRENLDSIGDINVTLDSHNKVHIAHPIWWVGSDGKHPDPFTLISEEDVLTGKWRTYNPGFQKRSLAYVQSLKANGRYLLCIWPEHCLIGTPGHNVVPEVMDALLQWEDKFRLVNKVTKGSNIFTEHYSAVKADVEDPEDKTTMLNAKLVGALEDGDEDILVMGEALSHCLANTITDVANEFSNEQVERFVLLTDATSNVPGFEHLGKDFIDDMVKKGMRLSTTDAYFA